MPAIDLEPFHDGYREDFERAVSELDRGAKRSHWMWFIFPQITGLGSSATAAHYAIRSRAEAEAFLTDATLGPAYCRLVETVWRQVVGSGVTIGTLMGHPDNHKLVSSLTLFAGVAGQLGDGWTAMVTQANEILDRASAQGLTRCAATERFLAESSRGGPVE